jgi:hypothetical protein
MLIYHVFLSVKIFLLVIFVRTRTKLNAFCLSNLLIKLTIFVLSIISFFIVELISENISLALVSL